MSIASISAITWAPITPITPVALGKTGASTPVQGSDSENAAAATPMRAAPAPGTGILVDMMV